METEHSQFSFLNVTVIALVLEAACALKRRSTFNDTTRRCITESSTIFKLVEHFFVKMKPRRFTFGLVLLQIAHWKLIANSPLESPFEIWIETK
jgi:hypothetical protein